MNDTTLTSGTPTLGSFLKQAREDAGIARRHLAVMSGVGRMTIQRLETDYYHTEPSADDLMRLARALELNETDLFLLAGLPVPKKAASLEVMLRTGYGIKAADVPDLKRQIEALIAEHAPTNRTREGSPKRHNTEGGNDTKEESMPERRVT
jgi:transcriptional regulator with XRE-family HTH domain